MALASTVCSNKLLLCVVPYSCTNLFVIAINHVHIKYACINNNPSHLKSGVRLPNQQTTIILVHVVDA